MKQKYLSPEKTTKKPIRKSLVYIGLGLISYVLIFGLLLVNLHDDYQEVDVVQTAPATSLKSQLTAKRVPKISFSDTADAGQEEKDDEKVVDAWLSPYRVVLSGNVKSAIDNSIIPHASIEIVSQVGSWSTLSNAEGKYRISFPFQQNASLIASKDGFSTLLLDGLRFEPKDNVITKDLVLSSFGVSGVVTNQNGSPIEKADVTAIPQCDSCGNIDDPYGYFHAQTDKDGRFRISGLNVGRYLFNFTAKKYATLEKEVVIRTQEEQQEMNVVLKPGKQIRGVVITKNDGDRIPVSGVLLKMETSEDLLTYLETQSQIDGKFVFENIPERSPIRIIAFPKFHKRVFVWVNNIHNEVVIELPSSASLEGEISYKKDGEPAEGKKVTVRDATIDPEEPGSFSLETTTNADGRYRFSQLPSGRLHVVVESERARLAGGYVQLQPGEAGQFNLELEDGYSVFGQVNDDQVGSLEPKCC